MFSVLGANRGPTDNQSNSVETVTNNDRKEFLAFTMEHQDCKKYQGGDASTDLA